MRAPACLVEKTKEIFCPPRMCVSVLAHEPVTETRPRVDRCWCWPFAALRWPLARRLGRPLQECNSWM